MEHEITDTETKSAKGTLTTIVKFNTTICGLVAGLWAFVGISHHYTSPWNGLFATGLMLGLLVTISALNARLRVELEEPDSAE